MRDKWSTFYWITKTLFRWKHQLSFVWKSNSWCDCYTGRLRLIPRRLYFWQSQHDCMLYPRLGSAPTMNSTREENVLTGDCFLSCFSLHHLGLALGSDTPAEQVWSNAMSYVVSQCHSVTVSSVWYNNDMPHATHHPPVMVFRCIDNCSLRFKIPHIRRSSIKY